MAIPSIVLGASLGSLGNNFWRDIPYLPLGFCLRNYGFWGEHSPFMSSTSIQTFLYLNLLVTFVGFYMVFPLYGFVGPPSPSTPFICPPLLFKPFQTSHLLSHHMFFYPSSHIFLPPPILIISFFIPGFCRH